MENSKPKYTTIMLIDDSDIDNMVNKHIITKGNLSENILVETAATTALDYFKKLQASGKINSRSLPQVILLDINMPIMNGFGFLEEFAKFDKEIVDNVKIIMLTSSVDPNDIKRSEEHPLVSGFISKPLSNEHLEEI
jgi:CheY-like chemotaxis protein